jgi:hypothetical protein
MDNQEFYDKSVAHLRRQGAKALMNGEGAQGGTCAYRTKDGLACAVGGVMPDDLAAKVVAAGHNTMAIGPLMRSNQDVAKFFRGVERSLIADMQLVHDWCAVPYWEQEFIQIAGNFRLTYTPPAAKGGAS